MLFRRPTVQKSPRHPLSEAMFGKLLEEHDGGVLREGILIRSTSHSKTER
jgi:hypothetical protein